MNSFYELKLFAYFATHDEAGEQEAGGMFFQKLPTKESINKAIDNAKLSDEQKDDLRSLIEPHETFEVGKGNTIKIDEYDTLSFQIVEHRFED